MSNKGDEENGGMQGLGKRMAFTRSNRETYAWLAKEKIGWLLTRGAFYGLPEVNSRCSQKAQIDDRIDLSVHNYTTGLYVMNLLGRR